MTDICVFAGRFRPFHSGHLFVIRQALEKAQYLTVMVGSCDEPINFRNPFTFAEVREMIRRSLTPEEADRVFILPTVDHDTDRQWVGEVQAAVKRQAKTLSFENADIALIGYAKDHSSYYLKLFPQWGSYGVPNHATLSATDFRDDLYQSPDPQSELDNWRAKDLLPNGSFWFLREWINTSEFARMKAEYLFMKRYLAQFQRNPYTDEPQTFNTADACIMMAGHTLLVRRDKMPGEGLWAMPGGHVHVHERYLYASAREAIEETGLPMTIEQLMDRVRGEKLLDDPWRSTRVRTVSMAYGYVLDGTTLPPVTGLDDARAARWWPNDEITRQMMFEDHHRAITSFHHALSQ